MLQQEAWCCTFSHDAVFSNVYLLICLLDPYGDLYLSFIERMLNMAMCVWAPLQHLHRHMYGRVFAGTFARSPASHAESIAALLSCLEIACKLVPGAAMNDQATEPAG